MGSIFSRIKDHAQGLLRKSWRLLPEPSQLKSLSSARFDWRAIVKSPSLYADIDTNKSGWYLFDVAVGYAGGRLERAYIDVVLKSGATERYLLPIRSGRPIRRVIYLPADVVSVHFSPLAVVCDFSILRFDTYSVPWLFAAFVMLLKLQKDVLSFKGQSFFSIIRQVQRCARSDNCAFSLRLSELYSQWFVRSRSSLDYAQWLQTIEDLNGNRGSDDISLQINIGRISLLMPTYNSDLSLLEGAILSVIAQNYTNWELCVVDDASSNVDAIDSLVSKYSLQHAGKFKFSRRGNNSGISETTNHAASLATGDFIGFIDHDDELHPNALLEVAKAVERHPSARIIYSDEDKIDEEGIRFDPHFKPDWNPDLFFSHNYLSHFVVCQRSLFETVGGLRASFDGAQDYDFILRCLAFVQFDTDIIHVPQVLYHWRTVENSTAFNENAKIDSHDAGLRAIADYLERNKCSATVESGVARHCYKVNWNIRDVLPKVSLIIPTRDNHEMLARCIQSVLTKTRYRNYEIIVVDNGSKCEETRRYLDRLQHEQRINVIVYDKPFNYSEINNFAVTFATGSLLGLLNDDVEVISDEWLSEMVALATRQDTGCVGAKLLYSDDRIQHAGVILGIGGVAGHSHKYFDADEPGYFRRLQLRQNLSAVTGACLLVSKATFLAAGGLDGHNLAVAFNDVDFCLKVGQLGYRNVWTPYALLYHHESYSRGADDNKTKKARFSQEVLFMQRKWGNSLMCDPAYNPNLSLEDESFSLRAPELLVQSDDMPIVVSSKAS